MPPVTLYLDVGSPYAYLATERIGKLLPEPIVWQPVLLGGLYKLTGRSSWALGDYKRRQAGMAEIEQRARSYGLPPVRWPDPFPTDYLVAMRVAMYAFTVGRGGQFIRTALRSAFQNGTELGVTAHVLDAAHRAGLDRDEALAAINDPNIKQKLRDATYRAYEIGVFGVPTLAIDGELFWGDDRLEDAVSYLKGLGCSV